LYHAVANGGNSERSLFAVRFRNEDTLCGKWFVPFLFEQTGKFTDVLSEVFFKILNALFVDSGTPFVSLHGEKSANECRFLRYDFVHTGMMFLLIRPFAPSFIEGFLQPSSFRATRNFVDTFVLVVFEIIRSREEIGLP